MEPDFQAYVLTLQQTMQAAIAESEQLQQAAKSDIESAADLRIQIQDLLQQYEHAAQVTAKAKAQVWLDHIIQVSGIQP
jgi:hypothetical protein